MAKGITLIPAFEVDNSLFIGKQNIHHFMGVGDPENKNPRENEPFQTECPDDMPFLERAKVKLLKKNRIRKYPILKSSLFFG